MQSAQGPDPLLGTSGSRCWKARPLIGVGFNAFQQAYDDYDFPARRVRQPSQRAQHLVRTCGDLGYLGFAPLRPDPASASFYAALKVEQPAKRTPALKDLTPFALGIQSGFVVMIVGGTRSCTANTRRCCICLLTMALQRIARETVEQERPPRRRPLGGRPCRARGKPGRLAGWPGVDSCRPPPTRRRGLPRHARGEPAPAPLLSPMTRPHSHFSSCAASAAPAEGRRKRSSWARRDPIRASSPSRSATSATCETRCSASTSGRVACRWTTSRSRNATPPTRPLAGAAAWRARTRDRHRPRTRLQDRPLHLVIGARGDAIALPTAHGWTGNSSRELLYYRADSGCSRASRASSRCRKRSGRC